MKYKFFAILVIFLFLGFSCSNEETVVFINGDVITDPVIDPVSENIAISPMLVGNNVWFRNPSDMVWQLTADSGIQSLRIGGNGYNDNIPSNTELINWVNRIQAMGAEPIMQVSQHDPASNAAALVKLFNVDLVTGKAIKYWNIGNEPWLEANRPATSTVGAIVEPYFKARAAAMKEVDPTIKIYGPDFAYYIEDALDDLFGGKNNIAGKVPGKDYYYCDGLSWHRYPQSDSANQNLAYEGLADFETSIKKCKAKIDAVNNQLNRTGDDALGWGIGEFNARDGAWVHNWGNGQMFAGILNLCMKYEAKYATTWSMFENGGSRSGSDYSFIDGNMTPRATYRHMEMVAENFGGLYAEGSSSKSDVIVFGSIQGSKISVMIINRANASTQFNLNLNATNVNTTGGIALNIAANSDLTYSGTIEGSATHTYIFENDKITRIAYTSSDFSGGRAPVVTEL